MKKFFKFISIAIFVSVMTLVVLAGGIYMFFNHAPLDLDARTAELASYCKSKGYNADYGILVDYGRYSFRQRFYVVDLKTGEVVMHSLCGHGRGGDSNILKAEFSNVPGSYCSSLGHYKIGRERRMYNLPADAFELDGLDETNSNARARAILLHRNFGPMSLGCITIPIAKYKKLSKFLQSQSSGVIIWAYA